VIARKEGSSTNWPRWRTVPELNGERAGTKSPLRNALGRLLKPYKVFPVDVGPEPARRKGYKRAQFEHLFEAYLNPLPPVPHAQPRSRAEDEPA
jgi:hypothetical protein